MWRQQRCAATTAHVRVSLGLSSPNNLWHVRAHAPNTFHFHEDMTGITVYRRGTSFRPTGRASTQVTYLPPGTVPRRGVRVRVSRLYKTGRLSIRARLPRDGLGPAIDADDLPEQFAGLLKFTAH